MPTNKPTSQVPSPVRKRSVKIEGHATSVSVEDSFWEALIEIARQRNITISAIIEEIDRERLSTNLSSGIRLFVLEEARSGRLTNRRPGVRRAKPK